MYTSLWNADLGNFDNFSPKQFQNFTNHLINNSKIKLINRGYKYLIWHLLEIKNL